MESKAEEFVTLLLSEETHKESMPNSAELDLPKWVDQEKYNRGRKFFLKYYFGFATSYIIGLMVVLVVPSILKVLAGTRRSSSPRTAYRRYWSTFQHLFDWLHYELKPGTKSWKSLQAVRKSHLIGMKGARTRGQGTISQRDIALTLAAGIGYGMVKPDNFGVCQSSDGDWEGYNHFWAVIGHFIGLDDRYNLCKRPYEETYEICQLLIDRVFTPCLENPPEYFEHMVRVTIDGASAFYPPAECESVMYMTKNLSGVPGYILKESERISLRKKMMKLNGNSPHIGVKSTDLIEKCAIEGLPPREPQILHLSDYDSIDTSPAYKRLSMSAKYKLALGNIMIAVYSTFIGRILINTFLRCQLFVSKYFPYIAVWRFGFAGVYSDDLVDDGALKPNSEFNKPQMMQPWYKAMF